MTTPTQEPVFKIPKSLLGVIFAIFSTVAGLWYSIIQNAAEQKLQSSNISKDVGALAKIVTRLESRLDMDSDTRYRQSDAVRDFSVVNTQLADHEARLRKLEAPRR